MTGANVSDELLVPVSVGEVIDKITILRIKAKLVKDAEKLSNIRKELVALEQKFQLHVGDSVSKVQSLIDRLHIVNQKLWDVEDDIRRYESESNFGEPFVQLARSVYFTNDERARLKREINLMLGSALIEEKSYKDYASGSQA